MASRHEQIVREIYAAFGRGDVQEIVERLHEDVEWEHDANDHGIPWLTPGRGRHHVMGFFEVLRRMEFQRFEPVSILSGEDQVAAVCRVDATYGPTGRRLFDLEVHLWTFDAGGKVVRFRHFADTLLHARVVGI